MTAPGGRRSQIIAVSMTVIFLLPLIAAAALLKGALEANRKEIADGIVRTRRLEAASRAAPTISAPDLERVEKQRLADFLTGANDPLILAALQSRLRSVVERAEGAVFGTQGLPRREIDHVAYIGTTMQIQATVESTAAIIHAIENARPLLFIERLSITPLTGAERLPYPAAGPPAGLVSTTIDVYGAIQPRPKPEPDKSGR